MENGVERETHTGRSLAKASEHKRDPIYIVVGNHRSVTGIQEIVHTILSCLGKEFPVQLSSGLKNDKINIVIDEFSVWSDRVAMKETKELYPNTKLILIATEFIMPVSALGIELTKTFNFFGRLHEWQRFLTDFIRPLLGKQPSYMRLRYLGFVRALKYWDVIAVVHKDILPALSELAHECERLVAAPLVVYPEVGPLTIQQQNRLRTLPIGFTTTGTRTAYRRGVTRRLIRTCRRVGWVTAIYKHIPFEESPANISSLQDPQKLYNSLHPEYLFNLNPPLTARWPFSSPMRLLRAIFLGQIPVVTKRFNDHPLEEVALLWDGRQDTALSIAAFTIRDREGWLEDYKRSIAAYDRVARQANKPFVDAVTALADSLRSQGKAVPTSDAGALKLYPPVQAILDNT
jgi:hypothetical protein